MVITPQNFIFWKRLKPRTKTIFFYGIILLFTCGLLVIPVSSYLAKYLLEKYDVQWLGREITVGRAYVNPYSGYVHLGKVQVFEEKGDSLFLSAEGVSATVFLPKLFNQTLEISRLTVDRPWGMIVQKKDTFNFDDLIRKFTPGKSRSRPSWHVTLLTTKIIDGELHYREKIIPINYFIAGINIESEGKKRNVDTIAAKFFFREGKSTGDMKGDFTINVKSADYRLGLNVRDFNLEIIRQYIWELINYGMFRAHLDAHISAKGNLRSQEHISLKGKLALRDLHLGKTNEDDYFTFSKMAVVIEEMSPVNRTYLFDSVILTDPYLRFERFDSLDNVQAMFGKLGKNISDVTGQAGRFNLIIEIARYVKVLARNFFKSEYKVGKLGIYNGTFTFKDFSINEEFSTTISPFTIRADSINSNDKRVEVTARSRIQPYGDAKIFVSINPKDSGDFDMTYSLEKIPAASFNPYLISYTSFPLDRGTMELKGWWKVQDGEIISSNHLILLDPRVTRRTKNKNTKWLPLPLIMAFIREQGNVIDYEIPITGNLKNPKFHLSDVIFDLIGNIFVKPPTTPYREEVKEIEAEIEKSLNVKWEMRQYALWPQQAKFVKEISEYLKDHPEAFLNVRSLEYTSKEKEYILFFEAKKKYFLLARHKTLADFSIGDSTEVSKMSIKDHDLVKHISKNLSDTVMFTLQEKCVNFVGHQVVNASFRKLSSAREMSFRSIFILNGTDGQLKMHAGKKGIPYNGFSEFTLSYPGEMPQTLRDAYEKMNEMNDEAPRKKYTEQRKKVAEVAPEVGR